MNGYICPCCDELIATSSIDEMRVCPTCQAPVITQRIIRVRKGRKLAPDFANDGRTM